MCNDLFESGMTVLLAVEGGEVVVYHKFGVTELLFDFGVQLVELELAVDQEGT
jgi:hypothetical protein